MTLGHSLTGSPGAWDLDPAIVFGALAAVTLYARGHSLLSSRRSARDPSGTAQACFYSGVVVILGALISPLHGWSERLFTAHMSQHLLLVLVAAPLLVLGRPTAPFIAALPSRIDRNIARVLTNLRARARFALHPVSVWAMHAIVLWAWHLPVLYDAALESEFLHALEHVSFVGTALLLWALVLGAKPIGEGASVLLLFGTGLQSAALGALFAFSTSPLYNTHAAAAPTVNADSVADQQLAGVIMWIPPGLIYLAISAVLLGRMLQDSRPGMREAGRP